MGELEEHKMKWFGYIAAGWLLCSAGASADWLHAMHAYEQQDFETAKTKFQQLLPLGNEAAVFNLGAMAYQGEGGNASLVDAMAYFMLADELGHEQASGVIQQLQGQMAVDAVTQARNIYQQLILQVQIPHVDDHRLAEDVDRPSPVRRVSPRYPVEAARRGQFGYVSLRFLVDESGKVQVVDTIDAYPQNVFERSAVRAVKRWRYEPSEQQHVMRVWLDFSLEGGVKVAKVEEVMDKHELWPLALAGSPTHQLVLGTLLRLTDIQSQNKLSIDQSLPLVTTPDLSVFEPHQRLRAGFKGFLGQATVRVDDSGTITEQLTADFAAESEVTDLVGLQLRGRVEHDIYRITHNPDSSNREPYISAEFSVPKTMSARFWWEQAARNGNRDAQRIMAAYDKHWESYLLAAEDANVMAWAATQMILDGQREDGGKLLEQAIAQNHAIAKALKKQLL